MKKSVNFKNISLIIVFVALFSASTISTANTSLVGLKQYITDTTPVGFRTGPTYRNKILRMIRPGSAVTVLEVNNNNWARIEYTTSRGNKHKGWIEIAMLQSQPVSRTLFKKEAEKLKLSEQANIQLTEEIKILKERLTTIQTELDTINKDTFEIRQDYSRLKKISGDATNIALQNDLLNRQVTELQAQNNRYHEQLIQAGDVVERQWFLTGGGVLLMGIALGLLLRRSNRKKKWDSL